MALGQTLHPRSKTGEELQIQREGAPIEVANPLKKSSQSPNIKRIILFP